MFFSDLNAALAMVLGSRKHLGPADFVVMPPLRYAAYVAQAPELTGDYTVAKDLAKDICAANTPDLIRDVCGANRNCTATIRHLRANPKLCAHGNATAEFVADCMQTRGYTPTGGGPSVVIEEMTSNAMLLLIVHEGVHRMRGVIWRQRGKTGHGRAPIGQTLEEGTTQILTDLVIAELQRAKGRTWFRGYVRTAYAKEVAEVKRKPALHYKDNAFLSRAYTADILATEVEELQSWQ